MEQRGPVSLELVQDITDCFLILCTMDGEVSTVDTELRSLSDQALNTISTLRTLGAPGTKPKASELSKTINEICKLMRGYLRDLEQLAEEQDT